MMSMLRHFSIAHEGVHHRGADDVKNLCRLVIRLLEENANFRPTWTERERDAERAAHGRKLEDALRTLEAKRLAVAKLPPTAPATARDNFDQVVTRLEAEVTRLRAYVEAFTAAGS